MTKADFNNRTKDNWRRWAWNRHRVVCPNGGTALIMAGTSTAEAQLGRDRGFSVISCDTNKDCVKNARNQGEPCVEDSPLNLLRTGEFPIVTLDWLGDLKLEAWQSFDVARQRCHSVVLNLLRGRKSCLTDAEIKHAKRGVSKWFPFLHPLHRGGYVAFLWADRFAHQTIEGFNHHFGKAAKNPELLYQMVMKAAIEKLYRFQFYSYRSRSVHNVMYYDSVHIHGNVFHQHYDGRPVKGDVMFPEWREVQRKQFEHFKNSVPARTKRKLAATKAVRTKRRRKQ